VAAPGDLTVPADVTQEEGRRRIVDEAQERFGRIDVLVNNAGVGLYCPAWRAPMDEVRSMFELNVFSLLALTQRVAPGMKERGQGAIVNVSSIAGKVPLAWFTAYSGTKFAVSAMSAGLRMELRRHGVHVMDVCPGYVRTGFQEHALLGKPPDRLWRMRRVAITPERCARALAEGVEQGKRTVVVPWVGRLVMAAHALAPGLVERYMESVYAELDLE
jgi:short-subunit dehydrogenase